MPIPLMPLDELPAERRATLHLVPQAAAPAPHAWLLYPRAIAHFVDACVVSGFSLYVAKLFSLLLVSLHSHAINGAGKAAGSAFRAAFQYSSGHLLAASFAAISVVYFVGLPLAWGRTPGLGLLGLRIHGPNGTAPTLRQLAYRLLGCTIAYVTGGLLCVIGLRQSDGRFLQDLISGTYVAKD